MDPFTSLLEGARARKAFVLRTIHNPPWSVRVHDGAPLSMVAVVSGTPWVVPDTGDTVRLNAGDIVLMRGPDAFTFTDDPNSPNQVLVRPGPRRTTVSGAQLPEDPDAQARTWTNGMQQDTSANDPSVLLIGKYREAGDVAAHLLTALPPVLVVPGVARSEPALLSLLVEQTVRDEPGQDLVLDRLVDLLLVTVLRIWFTQPDSSTLAWFRARGDFVVGPVLRLMHSHPDHPWTVDSLARTAGVSRATLARRFSELVGTPPMTYLNNRRIDLAADLLTQSDATIGSVAHQVGYGSAFTLSIAFKRARGISPQRHRDRT